MSDKIQNLIKDKYTMEDFKEIVKVLRSPNGCPWDKVQTHESMTQCLIEESYEVVEAIHNQDDSNLKEELGDVLLQVIMHSQIANERDAFTFEDVVQDISEKMIRRHPHVFLDAKADTVEAGLANWETIKQEEKKSLVQESQGPLSSIPSSFPALIRAQKVLKKSDKIYNDKKTAIESIDIIEKLLEKIRTSIIKNSDVKVENKPNVNDIGAIILEIVNIAKEIQENAENSLTNMVETFINKRESNKN